MNVARSVLYRPQLDALRAIAVIAVLVHHFLPVAKFIPEDFLTLGLLAVRLFFVLSGYLITGILLRSKRQPLQSAFKRTLVFGLLVKFFVAFGLSSHSYATVDWQLAGGILMPACLDSLALGGMLALIEQDDSLKRYRGGFLRTSLKIGTLIVLCQVFFYLTHFDMRLFLATSYLGVSLIFVWLVGRASEGFSGNFGSLLSWPPLLYVGKISYDIYLYHNFMPGLIRHIFRVVGWPQTHPHIDVLVSASAATTLTILISALSWHFVERPINSLKDRYGGLEQSVRC